VATKGQRARDGRMQSEPALAGGSRFRLSDLLSLAAMLLLATAVLWPIGNSVRAQGDRFACKAGLGSVASALGLYGGDFRDALPTAQASFAGPWWNVGQRGESNAANLYTLARTGYTKLDPLACPGNAFAVRGGCEPGATDWKSLQEVSFSYRIIGGPVRVTLSSNPSMIVAVDQSPIVRRAFAGQDIFPEENSANHEGRGQNVLTADGRVTWLCAPVTPAGDNIWLPRVVESAIVQAQQAMAQSARRAGRAAPIVGRELPQTADDQFVGP
jgi:hypothetical protein